MKNAKLKKLAMDLDCQNEKDFEVLNPNLQRGVKGGECFSCSGKFRCSDKFTIQASIESQTDQM